MIGESHSDRFLALFALATGFDDTEIARAEPVIGAVDAIVASAPPSDAVRQNRQFDK